VAQKDVSKFSFFPRTIWEWNLLSASVTDADKLEEFRVRIQNLPEPLPGSDYVCLDINKLMYDLEHDDETVVISSLLKWLPAKILYHMRHAARCALRVVVAVWDPHSSAETHKLEQVQRRAARFVHNNYTERTPGCVTHMVQNLGWQPLQQRRYNNRLIIC
jgi:hypothetical protein